MRLSNNALKVLKARYLLKDENGKITETPEQMFRRVARVVASSESLYGGNPGEWQKKFYTAMSGLLFLPNTPALINAGKDIGQIAACFVLPVDDSMRGIFDSLKNAALILQSGGGTGFSFSHLRPRSDIVKSTGGIASGPVSFMRIYNTATEVIKQGGARRGANMGILRIDHPDILEFIKIKRHAEELSNFNISVAVTDAFMRALKNRSGYNLINPRSKRRLGKLKASKVFNEIVESAWGTGDPGLVFIDRINRDNPTPHIGDIESTNPCGEQPLLPYEACVLGSINLSRVLKIRAPSTMPNKLAGKNKPAGRQNLPTGQAGTLQTTGGQAEHPEQLRHGAGRTCLPDRQAQTYEIDWELLESLVHLAVRFLDNTIDVNKYPIPEIEKMHKGNRKIGLGVMGWADMLIRLGIRYNSKKAFTLAREVMGFIREHSRTASCEIAKERGVFPNFKGSIYDMPVVVSKGRHGSFQGGMRNATTTTIAPTGTLSIIAECSSGIEPLFAIAYKRLVLDTELFEIDPYFLETAKKRKFYSKDLIKKIGSKGSLRGIKEVPNDVKRLFVTAHDIPPQDHIEVQSAFQEFTDNAVSKTINLGPRVKRDDVARAFMLAYDKGCKGITVFRYGSKRGTLMKLDGVD